MLKRWGDILGAIIGLILLVPLFVLVPVSILLDGGGPVLYRGERVGKGGRIFRILKFRTMIKNAAMHGPLTIANDARVTHVGRFLRKTKLDELPQLINVLRGDMSFVGPRPETPQYVTLYTPEQRQVLSVRPGITGISQIRFRNEEELLSGQDPEMYYLTAILPEKLSRDLNYVRDHTWYRDLRILLLTAVVLFRLRHRRPPSMKVTQHEVAIKIGHLGEGVDSST